MIYHSTTKRGQLYTELKRKQYEYSNLFKAWEALEMRTMDKEIDQKLETMQDELYVILEKQKEETNKIIKQIDKLNHSNNLKIKRDKRKREKALKEIFENDPQNILAI